MADWDFDYFGKGLEGYVQYMTTVNGTDKKDDPASPPEPDAADTAYSAPPRRSAPAEKTAAPEPAPGERARAQARWDAQKKKDRLDTVKAVLALLGFWLLIVFLFHDV